MCSDFLYQSSSKYEIVHNAWWSFKRARIYMARCLYAWNPYMSWSTAKYEQSCSVWHWGVFEFKQHNNRIVSWDHKTYCWISEVINFKLHKNTSITSIANNNCRYAEQIKIRSKLFQNQPMHPLDRAIFWIENAISNRGTKHLSLTNFELNFFQIYMLDAIGLFLLICFAFLFLMRRHIHFGNKDNAKDNKTSTVAVTDNVSKTEKIE